MVEHYHAGSIPACRIGWTMFSRNILTFPNGDPLNINAKVIQLKLGGFFVCTKNGAENMRNTKRFGKVKTKEEYLMLC